MTTRAVLLTRSGAVHRAIVGPDGGDQTACIQKCQRCSPVTPNQARVYGLGPCAACWPDGRWTRFLEGAS